MAVTYTKWTKNILTTSMASLDLDLDFWFEKIPSGNPGQNLLVRKIKLL
jgi:hypothetical protein